MSVRIDRRAFLAGSCAVGVLASGSAGRALTWVGGAMCALHDDQPYLDMDGRTAAYRPPDGIRGGQALAALDETTLRHAHFYL